MDHKTQSTPIASIWLSSRFQLISLIVANAVALAAFVIGNGSMLEVLWIYWLQSVVIGIVNIKRIMNTHLKGGLQISGVTYVQDPGDYKQTRLGNFMVAAFFVLHYGLFHFVYMTFLISMGFSNGFGLETIEFNKGVNIFVVALSGLAFWVHHNFSYAAERQYVAKHPEASPTLSEVMKRPYYRIYPMHLVLIAGPFVAAWVGASALFVVFIIIKTIADIKLFQASSVKFH